MPGGTAAIKQPWRMAAAYLDSGFEQLDVFRRNESQWADVASIARTGVNSPLTSSAGRLFDAVSAVLGLRDAINFEGQAAIELEQHADPAELGAYTATVSGDQVISGVDLVRAVAEDLAAGVDTRLIAARFHNGVVDVIVRTCLALRELTGVATVALSGGVFQNLLLLHRTVDGLQDNDFRVLTHSRVRPTTAASALARPLSRLHATGSANRVEQVIHQQ